MRSASETPRIPRLLITPGEPAGIGPDLLIQVAQQAHECDWVAVCDARMLAQRAAHLGLPLQLLRITLDAPAAPHEAGQLRVLDVPLHAPAVAGRLDAANAPCVLETLRQATRACLAGQAQALVTGPVQKSLINEAGIAFSGHTEFLAELCAAATPVMLLAAGSLRVALATTHLPLAQVPAAITREGLVRVLRVLQADLRDKFGIAAPRILVCGLNPHAGESGHLGREEIDTIIPALDQLRGVGMHLEGPLPADTLFMPAVLRRGDAVLAMYHDQGLPVLKHAGFGEAVNITLGLPIIRTSVDHGTALDLAGNGRADAGSLRAAIAAATMLADRQAT